MEAPARSVGRRPFNWKRNAAGPICGDELLYDLTAASLFLRIYRSEIVIHAGSGWENAWKDSESRPPQPDCRH